MRDDERRIAASMGAGYFAKQPKAHRGDNPKVPVDSVGDGHKSNNDERQYRQDGANPAQEPDSLGPPRKKPHEGNRAECQRGQQQAPRENEATNWKSPLVITTAMLVAVTFLLVVLGGFQLAAMNAENYSADRRFSQQMSLAHVEATSEATRFNAQMRNLQASLKVAATNAAATRKLANAASTEARQAGIAAVAAQKNADASIHNAMAAAALANTSQAALRVQATAAAATRKLAIASATQAASSVKLTNETSENASRDERPWIWTHPREDAYKSGSGNLNTYIDIADSGKSPAVRVAMRSVEFTGNPSLMLKRIESEFSDGLPDAHLDTVGAIPPSSGTAFYNRDLILTRPPTDTDTLATTDRAIAVVGRIQYSDTSGNAYYTDFCYYRLATAAYSPCEQHNEMH